VLPIEWKLGEPLQNTQQAQIDPAKLEKYSMNPFNPQNQGKWKAFELIGYSVQSEAGRQSGAVDVVNQIRQSLPNQPVTGGRTTPFGTRITVNIDIQGPNGNTGTLLTIWQFDPGSNAPRLITNWLKVH